MVAVAKTQAQNAADCAAMVGARTFNQQTGYNLTAVPKNAVKAAVANKIFNTAIKGDPNSIQTIGTDKFVSGEVTVEAGGYYYIYDDADPSKEGFKIKIPGKDASEPYTGVRVTVQTTSPVFFGAVFGANPFVVKADASAAHRPRDVVIIMDLSGSMNFQSRPGAYRSGSNMYPHYGPRTVSLNPEAVFPKFGHYSDETAAAVQGTSDGSTGAEYVGRSNISSNWDPAGPSCIDDFMSSGSTRAWIRDSSKDAYATTPGGDNYLKNGTDYVKTVYGFLGTTTPTATQVLDFERSTTGYTGAFNGYTEGPGYWGKTFFIWPPNPGGSDLDANDSANHANNGAKDWRQRFFFKKNTSTNTLYWLDHNTLLFNGSGTPDTVYGGTNTSILKSPSSTTSVTENGASVSYRMCINYAAIFQWLRNQAPSTFPSGMTTGRIKFYDSIPNPTGDNNFNNRFWTQSPMTNLSERFWKDYVDFMLGFHETGANTYSVENGNGDAWSSLIGNGDLFKWGTTNIQISQRPDNNYRGQISNGPYGAGSTIVKVNNISGSSTPNVGHYMRFGTGSTIYKILTAVNNSGTYTITLDTTFEASLKVGVANNSLVQFYMLPPRYMDYADNPYRPKHQYWFGAMSFVDWLGNYSVGNDGTNYTLRWPGNVHEAQAWTAKMGIAAAIDDIKNNHPNDFVGLTFFSSPSYDTDGGGQHNMAVIPLGRNYQGLKDSLWFPPSTVSAGVATITPYDPDFNNVPRAKGGTCPGMGLMIAYNLLSSSTSKLRSYATPSTTYKGFAGGLGRKGAQRLVIFETDGAPNTRAIATFVNNGGDSYYPIRIKDPTNIANAQNEFPTGGSYADSEVYDVVKQLVAMNTASPPGYSTTRKKAQVYALGYGALFDPANSSLSGQADGLDFLANVQFYGNVAGASQNGANFPDWQKVYGDNNTRKTRLRDAFTRIMQTGVQVSLIE
jgi:hypothetical protein